MLLTKSSVIVFLVTITACIAQIETIPIENDKEQDAVKSWDSKSNQVKERNFDDCGYQEIIVENPDKTITKLIIQLECVDEIIDIICDPTLENHIDDHDISISDQLSSEIGH